jgi:hypothetical protein
LNCKAFIATYCPVTKQRATSDTLAAAGATVPRDRKEGLTIVKGVKVLKKQSNLIPVFIKNQILILSQRFNATCT